MGTAEKEMQRSVIDSDRKIHQSWQFMEGLNL